MLHVLIYSVQISPVGFNRMTEQNENGFRGNEFDEFLKPDNVNSQVPGDRGAVEKPSARAKKKGGLAGLPAKQKKMIVAAMVVLGLLAAVMARKANQQQLPIEMSPEVAEVTEKSARMIQEGVAKSQAAAPPANHGDAAIAAANAAAMNLGAAPAQAANNTGVAGVAGPGTVTPKNTSLGAEPAAAVAADLQAGATVPAPAPAAAVPATPAAATAPQAAAIGAVAEAGDAALVQEMGKLQEDLKRWRTQANRDARRAAEAEAKLSKKRYTVVSVLADGAVIRDSDGREHIVGVGGKVGAE
jgi:hypothetical protein